MLGIIGVTSTVPSSLLHCTVHHFDSPLARRAWKSMPDFSHAFRRSYMAFLPHSKSAEELLACRSAATYRLTRTPRCSNKGRQLQRGTFARPSTVPGRSTSGLRQTRKAPQLEKIRWRAASAFSLACPDDLALAERPPRKPGTEAFGPRWLHFEVVTSRPI
jgi:hypothetical protein